MRTHVWAVASALCFFLGCFVCSLEPHYRKGKTVKLPGVDGSWKVCPEEGEQVEQGLVTFRGEELVIEEEEGPPSHLEIHFFKEDGVLLGDVTVSDLSETLGEISEIFVKSVHYLIRVELEDDKLRIFLPNWEWYLDAVEKEKCDLPHLPLPLRKKEKWIDIREVTFIATGHQWHDFLRKNASRQEIWEEEPLLLCRAS